MTGQETDWIRHGEGKRPKLAWSFTTEAPLVALQSAGETGETLAADAVGGLYLIAADGKLLGVTHGPSPIRAIGWSDTGAGGIALVGDDKLYWFDRRLTFQGWLELAEPVLAIALDAHGDYAVVSLPSCLNALYNGKRKLVRRFRSLQPLTTLEFLVHTPALVAVTEYGLLCSHAFTGEQLWQSQLWANVGDLSVTGRGESILLACFGHGIQCHDEAGRQVGSYQVGGTVCRVSASFMPGRLAAATMERHFYFLADDGQVQWQTTLPDDICRLVCDPFGKAVTCGFKGGRIARLEW
ncbi:MAG: hypothetical protein ACT4QC_10200 [Planctomycetaceae bacterium]